METMLKTGEVAQLLGVSRQHVANLCDRGEIEHIRVGTHRRVPRREVDRLMGDGFTREEEKSLRLHQALLQPMLAEPDVVISSERSGGGHRRFCRRLDPDSLCGLGSYVVNMFAMMTVRVGQRIQSEPSTTGLTV
ncbi:helix-turn-helix domain-containing protein [Mycobacterium heidelbergense]|uniref:helix-turn-helix domain-containing protein n=1 Tax=Mycobacterium heidelbergense TaxID=53376 RepID=UPI003CE7D080